MKIPPSECEELSGKIIDLIEEYGDTLDVAQVTGVLEVTKLAVVKAAMED